MKIRHTILIAVAVIVLVFIAVMWIDGWRLTAPGKNRPQDTEHFREFKTPPNFHFTAPTPH